jgi:hypothetical protein
MAIATETARARRSNTALEPDVYLSDGIRLFRVVQGFGWPTHTSPAVLEDCRSLEEHAYTPDELWTMGLTVVGAGL